MSSFIKINFYINFIFIPIILESIINFVATIIKIDLFVSMLLPII